MEWPLAINLIHVRVRRTGVSEPECFQLTRVRDLSRAYVDRTFAYKVALYSPCSLFSGLHLLGPAALAASPVAITLEPS